MAAWRGVYLTETTLTTDDGRRTPAPAGWWGGGVGDLLKKIGPKFDREGVVLLVDDGARLLGLPDVGTLPLGGLKDHAAIQDAARAGWKCSAVGDWSTFYGEDRPTIRLGLVHMMDRSVDRDGVVTGFPLMDGRGPGATLVGIRAWHDLTGSAYFGTPGMAGLQVMQALAPHRGEKGKQAPTWKPSATKSGQAQGWGPEGAFEDDYRPSQWRGNTTGYKYVQWYDKNRAYVSAAALCEVCPWMLKHTGRTPWSARLAGWWQVELAPWNDPRLPDPAGYSQFDEPGKARIRWLTGPRMALLDELTQEGIYGGVRLLDSWTGPARDSVLKPWATRMRDAYAQAGRLDVDEHTRYLVRRAVKDAGRSALGMLDRASNWAYRPDWWHAVVALNGANTWRTMRKIVKGGALPVRVEVDEIGVGSNERDPFKAAPAALLRKALGADPDAAGQLDPSGERLGWYKPKRTHLAVRPRRPEPEPVR